MKAAGSLGVVVCLFLVVVGVLVEVVPMAEGDTTPSQCKQEKDLLVSACKSAGEEPGFLPSPRVMLWRVFLPSFMLGFVYSLFSQGFVSLVFQGLITIFLGLNCFQISLFGDRAFRFGWIYNHWCFWIQWGFGDDVIFIRMSYWMLSSNAFHFVVFPVVSCPKLFERLFYALVFLKYWFAAGFVGPPHW